MAQTSLRRPEKSGRFSGSQQTSARHVWAKKQCCNIHYRLYMWSVGSHGYTEHTKDNKLSKLVVFKKDGSGLHEGKHRKHLMGALNTARSRWSELFMRKTFILVWREGKSINGFCGLIRTDDESYIALSVGRPLDLPIWHGETTETQPISWLQISAVKNVDKPDGLLESMEFAFIYL